MSDEWIKMRTNLRRHPKVVRISSALGADRLRAVGGLHAVWSVFDEHSIDGRLVGYTFDSMDSEIGWTGFSQAVADVGWLEVDGQALVIVDPDAHNGLSAKRRAQDNSRKKGVRKTSAKRPRQKRTKCGPEEEKKKNKKNEALRAIPEWLPQSIWDEFVEHRKSIKRPLTPLAVNRMLDRLAEFHARGLPVPALIANSIRAGWLDVFEPRNAPRDADASQRPRLKELG